jgi:hypothetical protein
MTGLGKQRLKYLLFFGLGIALGVIIASHPRVFPPVNVESRVQEEPLDKQVKCTVSVRGIFGPYENAKYEFVVSDRNFVDRLVDLLRASVPCYDAALYEIHGNMQFVDAQGRTTLVMLFYPHFAKIGYADDSEYRLYDSLALMDILAEYSAAHPGAPK